MRKLNTYLRLLLVVLAVYAFLASIQLLGTSLPLFGGGFAEQLIKSTSNPLVGLLIGVFVTSVIQSSSVVTSIAVAMVAGGALSLRNAIPIVMGANIGTTVTNTIVSMAHITRKYEFERAFAGATVHDFFNILTAMVLLPLETLTHVLERSATAMANLFVGIGGVGFVSPLNVVVQPAVEFIQTLVGSPIAMLIIGLVVLFASLALLVKTVRSLMATRMEVVLDRYLFRNDLTGFLLGLILTATIQSSSVTTSIVVPLVGAGLLTMKQLYPYTLGANIGTTITAFLASLVTLNSAAITLAFTHFLFNLFGTGIFYPLKRVPIFLSLTLAKVTTRSRRNIFVFLTAYYLLHIVPLAFILWAMK